MILGYTKLRDDRPIQWLGIETDDKTYHLIVEATLPNGDKTNGRTEDIEILELFESITKYKYITVGTDVKRTAPVASVEESLFNIMNLGGLAKLDDLIILHPNSYYRIGVVTKPMVEITHRQIAIRYLYLIAPLSSMQSYCQSCILFNGAIILDCSR